MACQSQNNKNILGYTHNIIVSNKLLIKIRYLYFNIINSTNWRISKILITFLAGT